MAYLKQFHVLLNSLEILLGIKEKGDDGYDDCNDDDYQYCDADDDDDENDDDDDYDDNVDDDDD